MVIVLHYPRKTERVEVSDDFSRLEIELLVCQSQAVCYEVEDVPEPK